MNDQLLRDGLAELSEQARPVDLLDRSLKAKLCFSQDTWAEQTSVLVRRALAA